jgi:hypothetical protein
MVQRKAGEYIARRESHHLKKSTPASVASTASGKHLRAAQRADMRYGRRQVKAEGDVGWIPDKIAPELWLLKSMKRSARQREANYEAIIAQLMKELRVSHGDAEHGDLLLLTLDFLRGSGSSLRTITTPENAEIAKLEAVLESLDRCIRHLERLVNAGDNKALEAYVGFVQARVRNLNSFASHRPKTVLPFSRQCQSWPALISKRKAFGDDCDKLLKVLDVGSATIADDPKSKFDPGSKFGKLVLTLIKRIENARMSNPFRFSTAWEVQAAKLKSFNKNADSAEKMAWWKVVNQLLDDDFLDPQKAGEYQGMITAPSYRLQWKTRLKDEVHDRFDSLWGIHRLPSLP